MGSVQRLNPLGRDIPAADPEPRESMSLGVFVVLTTPNEETGDSGVHVFGIPDLAATYRDAVIAAGGEAVLSRESVVVSSEDVSELIDRLP